MTDNPTNTTIDAETSTPAPTCDTAAIDLNEHPRGAADGKPGDRAAFSFETITRLADAADGKGKGGARYGRTGIIHTRSTCSSAPARTCSTRPEASRSS